MSYARFGENSDVYVFHNCDGYYECCGCILECPAPWVKTAGEMVAHLEKHRAAGHQVPDDAIAGLREASP